MKRRLLYHVGKLLSAIGHIMAKPWERLDSYGVSLWDTNCDCSYCQTRKARREKNHER